MNDRIKQEASERLDAAFKENLKNLQSTNINLYNTLITCHVFSVSVIGLMANFTLGTNCWFATILCLLAVSLSCLSSWKMFSNIESFRDFYLKMVHATSLNGINEPARTDQSGAAAKEHAHTQPKIIMRNERFSKYCLLYNFAVIFILIFNNN
jgi:cytochrome c biogenesis protein ResB